MKRPKKLPGESNREAVYRLISENPEITDVEIAKIVGLSHQRISQIRAYVTAYGVKGRNRTGYRGRIPLAFSDADYGGMTTEEIFEASGFKGHEVTLRKRLAERGYRLMRLWIKEDDANGSG
jgi:hypothetical protein